MDALAEHRTLRARPPEPLAGSPQRGLALVLTAFWALGACTVTQQLHLHGDGSGETTIAIDYSAEMVALVQELAELPGAELRGDGIINLEPIHYRLMALPGVTVYRVEAPERHRVEIEFAFRDAREVLPGAAVDAEIGLVTLEESKDGTRRVRLYLDLANYGLLSKVFPLLEDPVIRSMGPQENTQRTQEDYLEVMSFILGPTGPDALSASLVTVHVTADGELVSQRGGRVEGGRVVFEVPLLDLLLLPEPLDKDIVIVTCASDAADSRCPGPPTGLAAQGEAGSIILGWDDPADAAITGYQIRLRHPADRDWRPWRKITGGTHLTTSHTLPGLTAGARYRVQVRAINPFGAGEPRETAATP